MRITQGTFSFLPDLTDDQIRAQIDYCAKQNWAVAVEYTDDPHPRNVYWEMWERPTFDIEDPEELMQEVNACREAFPDRYIKVNGFDRNKGWETIRLSFIVNRPAHEPGFGLFRTEAHDRVQRYAIHPYVTDRPSGERYSGER